MKVPAVIDYLILPLRLVMVAGVLYALALTVRFFIFGIGDDEVNPADLKEFDMPTEVSVEDIIAANLFGELPTVAVEPQIEETTLNLRLVGISYNAEDPPKSSAYIIGRSSQSPKRHAVGARVEGIAELTDIFADHVLLLRGGKKESLFFEEKAELISTVEESSFVPARPQVVDDLIAQGDLSDPVNEGDDPDATQAGWVRQYYETYRKRIEEKPNEFLDEIGITAVAEESASGYRLEATMAEHLGLRAGDVLLTVNGYKVGNVQEDLTRFGDHLDAESLKLEIQRGETKLTVNYKPSK